MTDATQEGCDNCRFSLSRVNRQEGSSMVCRRFPPRAAVEGEIFAQWPGVVGHQWCGEWAARPETPKP